MNGRSVDTMSAVDSSELVILVPMLGRPHHVAPLLESIREATPGARVLPLLTRGDDAVRDAVEAENLDYLGFPPNDRGDYAIKINAGYRFTREPFIFTGASDIRFEPGWFEAAVKHFDDPRIGVVGTNDVHARRSGSHATHFLVRRSYADEFGTLDGPGAIWPEAYIHEFGDDELEWVAIKRGAYVLEPSARVPHLHPFWGQGEWDDIYRQMGPRQDADAPLLRQRRQLWNERAR